MPDPETTRLQIAINARHRVDRIAVDGIHGPETERAEIETGRLMGVHPYKGSKAAQARRRAVIHGARRTPLELARAKRLRTSTASGTPRIVRLDAPMSPLFGPLGPLREPVGHYTAGPRDTSDSHALSLLRTYNQQHRDQGWGAIGYHLAIASSGTLILCRPVGWKGAHTAGQNTGRIGIVVLGGGGQRMTAAQRRTLAWWRGNGHTAAMPASHRSPGKVGRQTVHRDWNATSCAGEYSLDYKAA
jgi:hypothetical protein